MSAHTNKFKEYARKKKTYSAQLITRNSFSPDIEYLERHRGDTWENLTTLKHLKETKSCYMNKCSQTQGREKICRSWFSAIEFVV